MPHASLGEIGRSLVACTPDDPELQIAIVETLQTQQAAMRAATWTDLDVVLVEALLFHCHEGKVDCVYVGELGKTAVSILVGRGEPLTLAPKNVAARIRLLGVRIEARDQRGYRVLLTQTLSRQLHALACSLDAPSVQDEEVRCDQCELSVSGQRPGDDGSAGRSEPNEPNVHSGRVLKFRENICRKAVGGGKEDRMERKWQADIEMERRLRAAGVPLEAGEDDGGIAALPAYGLSIMQTGECSVFDLDPCGVGYTIELCIVPNLPWPFEISTLELDLPWEDTFLHWLPDPLETYAKDGMYWLPTREPLGYPRDQVINHLVGAGKRFSRGRSFGGLLLGVGASMPDTILQGSEVPALVRISDQFGKQYSSAFSLRASRMDASRRTQLQEKRATRKSLFACPDPEKSTKSASCETRSARDLVSDARGVSRKKK